MVYGIGKTHTFFKPSVKISFITLVELFIVSCLGVMSHFRFKKLLQHAKDTPNGRAISQKICYFQEINIVLSTALFGHGSLLTTLSIDGLTIRKYLNIHKFSADFFICNSKIYCILKHD